jgi:TRAP transporter TAXI family solute receptor
MALTRRLMLTAMAAAVSTGIALGGKQAQAQDANYILATATTGGTYYPVGVALATLTKVKLQPKQGIGMSAINSAGSGENVRLLREKEAQFAILQGLFGYYAVNGVGPVEADGKQEHLRSVTMLWQNVEQYVIPADKATTGTIDDLVALKGGKGAFGAQNSGTLGSNTVILRNLGLDINSDFDLFFAGYGPSVEALQNGQVDAVGAPGGVPTGAISQLLASAGDNVKMLSMTPEQQAKADGGMNLWTPYTIPAGTYPGQDTAVETIAQPNFLAVHADVPEEHVYLFTKTIYENLPFLQAIHPATKAMAIEKAIGGLPAPLHPGAARYYKEVGIDIPDSLMAK